MGPPIRGTTDLAGACGGDRQVGFQGTPDMWPVLAALHWRGFRRYQFFLGYPTSGDPVKSSLSRDSRSRMMLFGGQGVDVAISLASP